MLDDKNTFNNQNRSIQELDHRDDYSGLVAYGGDLEPMRLIQAYRAGVFPWYNEEPVLWWSPDPRCVIFPQHFKASRSLRKSIRKYAYRFTTNHAFTQVIQHCARPELGPNATWIHEEMIDAYTKLHDMGYAHSVETWMNHELVGGLYGLAIGRIFFGESMFSINTDASKAALAYLAEQLTKFNYVLIDCQVTSKHLLSMGAEELSRDQFLHILKQVDVSPTLGLWNRPPDSSVCAS
ncbi:MAG: leucyl/phenylalanyl-tRNA--protein transferase [Gammaproteobacteria bacterium]|nr:leucyl/phenylalanyl-tRNA--protein transferase [Gammaproteobacteria bacterium]MCY4219150.1 leucyl/phenylalanyl-tRNA--protein transferase [Gammaproteobacteria bacterium]